MVAWLPIINTALAAFGAYQGSKQQGKQNSAIEQQAAQQQQIIQKQLELADKMYRLGLATTVDANGNITFYDESTNTWKSILAPKQQELQDLSDFEQRSQLKIDAPLSRAENIKNASTRSKEGMTAESMRMGIDDLLRTGGISPDRLASSMRLGRQGAVNAGYDEISNHALTAALRSGSSGMGDIISSIARNRSKDIARTLGDIDIEALAMSRDLNQQDMASRLTGYNTMATRASNGPLASFNPVGVGSSLASSLAAARQGGMTGGGYGGNLLAGAGAGVGNLVSPDYTKGGPAALAGSIGNLLNSGILDQIFQRGGGVGSTAPKTSGASKSGWK